MPMTRPLLGSSLQLQRGRPSGKGLFAVQVRSVRKWTGVAPPSERQRFREVVVQKS